MAVSQFLLRYGGLGSTFDEDLTKIASVIGLEFVNQARHLVVVRAEEDRLRDVINKMPDWGMFTVTGNQSQVQTET